MKKLKPYLLTSGIVLGILIVIFLIKGIYPFGSHSLIWGDMHDQITAFYYHFYDSIRGNSSLLIDFTTSGSINFLGIMAYYILSPFSLLVLLVERDKIYLMVSVIVALKILASSLTCLYFIKNSFQKIPALLSILLAIIYAFSGYSIIMYQITPWIDVMYMFPLIIMGLRKVLDLEKPTLYIISLSLSLIFSFYVSIMVIIFIFLSSFIYLLVYKDEKKDRKQGIVALGISTILSLLISLCIVVPSYLQISISSRMGFSLGTLLNARLGPITDKLSMFLFGGILYVGILLLLKNYKKHIKFLSFYIPVLLIMIIPVFIEPINKIWHFGSYASFPYRAGFIAMFLLVLGACYSFEHCEPFKGVELPKKKVASIVLTAMIASFLLIIMYVKYHDFQVLIHELTISSNHFLLLVLALSTIASICGCFMILLLNKKFSIFSIALIGIISITHILVNTSTYLGIDYLQDNLTSQYEELNQISHDYQEGDYYRVKNEAINMIMNSSMVMKYHGWDHYTSLTDANTLTTLKRMGYSSMWVKTYSRGGNLFLDSILANKYLMTRGSVDENYYQLVKEYGTLKFYSLKQKPSYGYFVEKNESMVDKKNSFEVSNTIYQNITGKKENIFEIIEDFQLTNIRLSAYNENTNYEIIDKNSYAYIETTVNVLERRTLYLEILRSLVNHDNALMYEHFNVYINDKLYRQKAFSEKDNGPLNLGTYENETVNIKIELLKTIDLDHITLGLMDNQKYENFIQEEFVDTKIDYHKNRIRVNVTSDSERLLMLPISYNEGYRATNNGKEVEIVKVFDNFMGIILTEGENNIEFTFMPKGFLPCFSVSLIAVVITIILLITGLYKKLIHSEILSNICYTIFIVLYLAIIGLVYIGGILVFIASYFITISI